MDIRRLHVRKTLSEAATCNGAVHPVGQVPVEAPHDIVVQIREAPVHVDRLSGEAGSDKSRIRSIWRTRKIPNP